MRKQLYDKKVNSVHNEKDDLIVVKNETGCKIAPIYKRTYVVLEDLECNVKVNINNKTDLIHKNGRLPAIPNTAPDVTPLSILSIHFYNI